ncbi:armadillo-type protein [Protomyces lactucae-debilis]|uniref:Armadillo-type protein n=1 Tax=Protomyces lactucae-debilis TaxID=2754530 RepID=A0A1Y2F3X8_PROLT|nr:armadillo-type protein [Protomyces lactucae-debilis]ORY78618.1 armadillo-type protein [Protomyces lactucae-debilis]
MEQLSKQVDLLLRDKHAVLAATAAESATDRTVQRQVLESIAAATRARMERSAQPTTTNTDEQVKELSQRLDASLSCLELMKMEVKQLKLELAQCADHDESFSEVDFAQFDMASDESSKEEVRGDVPFPKLENALRIATPLPSPAEPGAASAFMRAPLERTVSVSTTASGGSAMQANAAAFAMPKPRKAGMSRQSSDSGNKIKKPPTPRYEHLTFFPGTSNTPTLNESVIWSPPSPSSEGPAESYDSRHAQGTDWTSIVDRIVYSDDQQASVSLQQRLKISSPEAKSDIVDAIVEQAFALMLNRFGNFLIQRCFEHGTAEQCTRIATTILGNVLVLSKDAFGCHVVQKAFDNVTEENKVAMAHELLAEIKETIVHRHACHVWQKLLEVNWRGGRPDIMGIVNKELVGWWHNVALGETGSLVVQNVFENCIEEERRPCIEEVIAHVDLIIRGQWGNWVIQHIVEHGQPDDKERVLSFIMEKAADYSVDQYASKVLEKAVKSGNADILERYLTAITQPGDRQRPRMALIDIASDQYGNYLVQYLLSHGTPAQRETASNHIRKHMVSMRGSRYGAKVAFTVERMRAMGYEGTTPEQIKAFHERRGRGGSYSARR